MERNVSSLYCPAAPAQSSSSPVVQAAGAPSLTPASQTQERGGKGLTSWSGQRSHFPDMTFLLTDHP